MATLEVNNNPIDFKSNEYLNLKSLIPQLQKNFPLDEYSVLNFQVNGISIDINSEDPVLIRPIQTQDHIQVSFNRNEVLLADIVAELPRLLNTVIKKILLCVDEYNEDNLPQATMSLSKVIDAVEIFIESLTYILKNSPNKNEKVSALPTKELQIHLLSVLKAINTASTKEDTIMLTDLLEYELKDNLTQWKILIIPVLKQNIREQSTSL